ncbi:hypothetical protein IQ230_22580 [Gloeocapsopsis crepidinum LEGE 06123]|uniref:HNH endonuclease n=1 Tax=Gloeocapsopsis crepidinum LEGE 06123 TaxID=588587 RepID=A0ABR9UXS7_9CHRO|nr:hypothetical protein [Gloeocapsopsis crepidinum]MBE9193086.1 hypothetical protein [Gloeocapsopsis crepidinum LEGE 06123]
MIDSKKHNSIIAWQLIYLGRKSCFTNDLLKASKNMKPHKLKLITTNNNYLVKSQSLAGVSISDRQNIPAGAIITTQSAANRLPTHQIASKTSLIRLQILSVVS